MKKTSYIILAAIALMFVLSLGLMAYLAANPGPVPIYDEIERASPADSCAVDSIR